MDLHEPNVEEMGTSTRTKHDLRWVLPVSKLICRGISDIPVPYIARFNTFGPQEHIK